MSSINEGNAMASAEKTKVLRHAEKISIPLVRRIIHQQICADHYHSGEVKNSLLPFRQNVGGPVYDAIT